MKKTIVLLGLIFAALTWTPAYADTASMYFSSSQGGASETVFDLNSALWMYTHLPLSGAKSLTNFWITSPYDESYYKTYKASVAQNTWYDLTTITYTDIDDNTYSWNDIKTLGTWDMVTSYTYPAPNGASSGSMESGFTLVPEPISCTLFLLGGGALFAIRRKKALHI
ncbi:MAG: hypothetical protein WCY10_01010 [Candidatus Omnitrophota bacterium]